MSGQFTPALLDTNELNPECFKMTTNGSLRSTQTVAAFNGLKTYNPNETQELQELQKATRNEPTFGESFGRPDSISSGSQERM